MTGSENERLSVREIQNSDVPLLVNYWRQSDHEFMKSMGVDVSKIPSAAELTEMLSEQLTQDYSIKKSYCVIWQVNGVASGHCNVNKIQYGEEAYMHLHFWDAGARKKGDGAALVVLSLPYFFKKLELKNLYCEPYALNPAPNRTLEKIGFELVKEHLTVPGYLNFEQKVKLWKLEREKWLSLSLPS